MCSKGLKWTREPYGHLEIQTEGFFFQLSFYLIIYLLKIPWNEKKELGVEKQDAVVQTQEMQQQLIWNILQLIVWPLWAGLTALRSSSCFKRSRLSPSRCEIRWLFSLTSCLSNLFCSLRKLKTCWWQSGCLWLTESDIKSSRQWFTSWIRDLRKKSPTTSSVSSVPIHCCLSFRSAICWQYQKRARSKTLSPLYKQS